MESQVEVPKKQISTYFLRWEESLKFLGKYCTLNLIQSSLQFKI